MIRFAQKYFSTISPVFLDGFLYFLIAVFGAIQGIFSTDEAAKFVSPEPLFWIRSLVSVLLVSVTALKMYRSTTFAEHKAAKEEIKTNGPTPTP